MRRGDRYCDAGIADLDSSDAMVQRQPGARPSCGHLGGDALERVQRQRLVRFVLQMRDAAADVVIPHQPEEGRDGAIGSGGVTPRGRPRARAGPWPAVRFQSRAAASAPAQYTGGAFPDTTMGGAACKAARSEEDQRRCQKWSSGPCPCPTASA